MVIEIRANRGDQIGKVNPEKALRVLIMEDDAMIGMLLAAMLEGLGYDVCAIEATEAAGVTAAAQYRPDLMIVDARLGNGSGVSAVEKILLSAFIPHVLMSGNIASVKTRRPDAVVLQKPFGETALTRAIQGALDIAVIAKGGRTVGNTLPGHQPEATPSPLAKT